MVTANRTEVRLGNSSLLAGHVGKLSERRVVMRLEGLKTEESPGVAYNVYLNLPTERAPQGARDPNYLGAFSFFDTEGRERTVEIDITEPLKRIAKDGIADARLTIVPAGNPTPSARPRIGQIQITAR